MDLHKGTSTLEGSEKKNDRSGHHRFRFVAVFAFVLAVGPVFSIPSAAQTRWKRFGCLEINDPVIKGGVSGSALTSSLSNDPQYAFAGGFSFLNGGSDLGGWQVEALVHQKGSRGLLDPDDSLRVTYLQGALLSHLDISQFGPGDTDAFYLIGGAGLSFKIHSSYSGPGELDGVRFADFDLIAGAGIHVGRMILEGRYDWGYISPVQLPGTDRSLKNRDFALMAGWKL